MKKKTVWLIVSCLMVLSLVLVSCAPAVPPAEKPAAPPAEKPAAPPAEKPAAPPADKEEMVKVKLTKLDGTVVEKMVEKPKYGGVITMGHEIDPLNFDDIFVHAYRTWATNLTNEDLLMGDWGRGPAGTGEATWMYYMMPPPGLDKGAVAESWDLLDPDTIVYHIRKGIHFHNRPPTNGRELDAYDVEFSLNRIWDAPTAYHSAGYPKADFIESIKAPDKWTVIFKCKPGKAGLVFEAASEFSKIWPRDAVEEFGNMNDWRQMVGTGAFIITDYVRGSSLTFERSDNYWQKDPVHPENQLPYLDGVKYLFIPDFSTRYAALRTAKVDWLGGIMTPAISWEDAESMIKNSPELMWVEYYSISVPSLDLRVDKPDLPFYDVRVRRALGMAINNKEIVDTYYGGHADWRIVYPTLPVPEFKDAATPFEELPQSAREVFEYHPDKAKQLLAEAGYPDGFKTEVVCTAAHVDLLCIIKEYWAKIGVELILDVREPGVYTSMTLGTVMGHKEMVMAGHMLTNLKFGTELCPGYMSNRTGCNDPVINEAWDEWSARYFEVPGRFKVTKDITPYLHEQVYFLTLPLPTMFTFWQPWVKGYHGETQIGYVNNYDFPTYIWYDQDLKMEMIGRR